MTAAKPGLCSHHSLGPAAIVVGEPLQSRAGASGPPVVRLAKARETGLSDACEKREIKADERDVDGEEGDHGAPRLIARERRGNFPKAFAFLRTSNSLWLGIVALPQWLAGHIDESIVPNIYACSIVVLVYVALPWRYAFSHYVKAKGDRWR